MDFKITALVLLVGLMAGFAFGSDAQITGMATGGGTHTLNELPQSIVYVDSSSGIMKEKKTERGVGPSLSVDRDVVAAEARKVDTKQGVVISGNTVQANTLITYATQSTTYLYTPDIYTGTIKAWSGSCDSNCVTSCQIGPSPGCYKVLATQSGAGFSIDTKGGEVTTGKITTTGDIAIGGKITSTSGNNLLQSQVSGGDSILKAQSVDTDKPALRGITTANTGYGVYGEARSGGTGIFGKSSSGPGIQGEGNPGLKTTGNAEVGGTLNLNNVNGIVFGDNFRLATGTYDDGWLRILNSGSTNPADYAGASRNGGLAASNLWAKNDIYLGAKGKWLSEITGCRIEKRCLTLGNNGIAESWTPWVGGEERCAGYEGGDAEVVNDVHDVQVRLRCD